MTTSAEARPGPAARTEVLENGLTVCVLEEHTAPLASVWCWYRVGSRDEPAGLTGISHWVEHMNFRGTVNIPRDRVKGIIEQFGGFWNGYTWLDQTAYVETATREALDRMLFIEAERMSSCLYDPDDCETERTVIISELEGGENDPETLLDQEVTAAAFRAHPYGHPTIGWLADVRAMTREDLFAHYRRYYIPNNATLVIVGDVQADEVMRRVRHHFGDIAPGVAVARRRVEEPAQTAERRVRIRREGTTAYLKLAHPAPSVVDSGFEAALALDAILTGAKGVNLWSSFRLPPPQRSARLYQALVERGLASSVFGVMLPTAEPFLYTVSVTATDGTPLGAIEEVLADGLDRVRRDGVTERELARAKTQLRTRLILDDDSITDIAHQLGYFATVASVDAFQRMPGRISALTVDDVNEVAARIFAPASRTVGWFEPDGPDTHAAGVGRGSS